MERVVTWFWDHLLREVCSDSLGDVIQGGG
jgi:hypothetical protein